MKWYQKPLWIVVFLVFFFPVGIFLLWKYTNLNKTIKIIISVVSVLITIVALSSSDKKTEAETTTTTIVTTTEASATYDSITFSEEKYYVNVGEELDCHIEVVGDKADKELITIYSSNEDVATVEYIERKSYFNDLYFVVKGVSEGDTIIHAESKDGTVDSYAIVSVIVPEITEFEEQSESISPLYAVEYVLNTNTMKIHESYCSSVEDIKPGNYATTDDYDGAIADGYKPCKKCNP